jgi:hypothetical protein
MRLPDHLGNQRVGAGSPVTLSGERAANPGEDPHPGGMRILRRRLAGIAVVAALATAGPVAVDPGRDAFAGGGPALTVLFVGNSLIGTPTRATGEDTPAVVAHLAAAAGRRIQVGKVIHFGNTLRQTYEDGEVTAALAGSARYDFVVLQEYSTLVATHPAEARRTLLTAYVPRLSPVLRPGGRVVLFEDWVLARPVPFADRAAAARAIGAGYARMAAALPLPHVIAPIGGEFERVIARRGGSALLQPDGKHPDDTAVYLDAVTLYGILFAVSPRDLPDLYLGPACAREMREVAALALGY